MDTVSAEKKIRQNQDLKKAKLLKAFENNIQISNLNLPNKFISFEEWELTKSNRLLYEISRKKNTYQRFPRGSIIKVDFGVNVGGEFSQQHFAITLNKKDNMYNNTLTVIPLTSKPHKNTLNLGSLIVDAYLQKLQKEIDDLQKKYSEIDIENCEWNPNYKKEIKSIETILKYYKKTRNNLSYVRIDQIRTISKLNIIPPMNQYDVVGKIKCSDDIMKQIDNEIIVKFTSVDFPQFELWRKGHEQNP